MPGGRALPRPRSSSNESASRKEGLARVQQWLKVFIDFAPNVSVCTEWGTVNKYQGRSRIQIEQVARTARSVEGRCDGIMEGAILNTWGLLLVVNNMSSTYFIWPRN